MVHRSIMQWITNAYPKPKIDPDWLNACYAWVLDEFNYDAETQSDQIQHEIEMQLLESDLSDSTVEGTGLPPNTLSMTEYRLRGGPILVEIAALTEIGHSAFNLQNIRQTRLEKVDLNGLVAEDADAEQESIPKYPRTMLRLELSDGAIVFPAIEYRPLSSLVLGETPLGYKMILKEGLLFRRGIAFLEQDKVVMMGHKTEERVSKQDTDFLNGLRKRLGKPDAEDINTRSHTQTMVRPASSRVQNNARPSSGRTTAVDDSHMSRKRKNTQMEYSSAEVTDSTIVPSPYFSTLGTSTAVSSSSSNRNDPIATHMSRLLSPTRGGEDASYDWDPEGPPTSESGSSGVNRQPGYENASKPSVSTKAGPDSDFDFDDDTNIDDAFLEEIAKMEEDAFANIQPGSSFSADTHRAAISDEVIVIDDFDEDKENLPNFSSQRSARSQIRHSQVTPDVIDISDMD